jgi:hypothetical protein
MKRENAHEIENDTDSDSDDDHAIGNGNCGGDPNNPHQIGN